jgi:hypothetical protein
MNSWRKLATGIITGYLMIKNPSQLTQPLPTAPSAAGDTSLLTCELLDELNKGIGGTPLFVQGDARSSPINLSITDAQGKAILQLEALSEDCNHGGTNSGRAPSSG